MTRWETQSCSSGDPRSSKVAEQSCGGGRDPKPPQRDGLIDHPPPLDGPPHEHAEKRDDDGGQWGKTVGRM